MEKPLIYYAISVFLGCISVLLLFNNILLGAVFTASFLIIIFINEDSKNFIIILLFFILAMFSFYSYFTIDVPDNIKVRIVKKEKYYCFGDYKGRNIFIIGKTKDLKEGLKTTIEGQFTRDIRYRGGSLGSFKVKKVKGKEEDIVYNIYNFKSIAYNKFKEQLGENKTAMVMSLCFGETKYISNSDKDILKKLGVIHAVSVSGFHMAIIYKLLERVLGLTLAIPVSFLYVILTGMKSSAIRAFIMIIILKLSKKVFREYDSLSSISLAAIIILLNKPYYILDIGFMLSFLSTLGILLYNKKISMTLYKLPQRINSCVSLTLSSQVYTFPYMCFTIQSFGLGFIIGNLVLVPLYAPIVLLGNLAMLLIKIPFVFKIINKIIYIFLIMIEGAQYLLSNITPDCIYIGAFEGICFVIIYMSYVLYKHGYKNVKYMPLSCIMFLILFNYTFFPSIDFYREKDYNITVVKYKFDTIMLCNYESNAGKNILRVKQQVKPDKVITNIKNNTKINLDKNLKVYILSCEKEPNFYNERSMENENKYSKINILLKNKNKNIVFTEKPISLKIPKNNYVIINLKEKNYTDILNKRYIVVFNKILCLK
ncbi:competence protein ComEC [Clostridium botulinum]|uniref:ComEC/Rec2 family competence protein n=1 Tax=Clostridium botulinum TaxID=1491 RepID=UPI0006A729B7|nr:ComEC/Rec2 family competence protein [Clostridium botulinum]KOM97052.1 competence protein ComEC [Clostridium botulinum]KOM99469.1 competence protein ComEC [Clostridium botulinum]MBY7004580.1 ComEC/Rec2 family competence protein [Clostridium botulinum]MCR1147248.1 ComEC/Rec2 family competence protein [Clostridium botulinum]NFH94482.1 ComEC/Rec2 family competence protein [Clostridium botulinum]